ncbi:zinc finger protein 831 [Sorex araneus]|uniref:zinc finger protein 831 n=1 Tax=Sorex araneus TaxID=42254 RepID=UPI002433AE24|nr:zinc finger protein 831 [Sorex araneus]
METPTLTCPPSPARDQPALAPSPAGAPGGQASPGLTLGPVILPPPEPGLAPTLLLKALPVPLYHMVPPGGLQPRAPLLPSSLEGGGAPLLLSPLLQPEGPGPAQGKRGAPTLTVNLVGALPVLSPGPGPPLGSPGRARGAGRHLCPHCGRDCGKPSVLEKHIRSHTGERPFPCASCGIAFKTQSNLYKHRRTQTHLSHSRLGPQGQDPKPGDEEDLSPARQKSPAAGRPGPPPQPWEKAADARAPEGRLRKCESTDSGYLSRSDSAEQPPAPGSPGASAEPDGEGARGTGPALEKRQLEERIARLISHNQAVVADPQLEHVRPRRSLLGARGSLDLAPGALRGAFPAGPRAPRRRLAPARSALGPPARPRPLFFHSVPTQLSTGAECGPVTRSNSLPAVEGVRTWPEPQGPRTAAPRGDALLSPRPGPAAGLGGRLALTVVAVPSGHPRALVRQAAVEDLPGPPAGDGPGPAEEPEGPRAEGGGPAAGRARATKRASARRSQMFSQEKWQVYGRDSFQKLYQKTSSGRPGGTRGTPSQGGVSVLVQSGPQGPSPAPGTVLEAESPTRRDTGAKAGDRDESLGRQARSLPTLSCQEGPGVGQRVPLLAGAEPRSAGSPGQCGGHSGVPRAVEGSPLETKRVRVEGQSGQGCLEVGASAGGSPRRQDTPPSRNKEPPLCPEAAPPGAPSILTAPSEPPFPPKYLLRLPQGEAPGGAQPASGVSGPGTDGFKETPGGSRSGDRSKGELQGAGRGRGGTPPTPVAGDCPREGAPFPPTPTWDPRGTKDAEGGACGAGGGRDCAGGRPRAPSRERGASLEDPSQASEGPHVGSHVSAPSSGAAGGRGAPFPSLRAEPQLTWCCLHRSLPLALEQGDTGASAYLAPPPALATRGGSSPGPRGQTQPPACQLPCPPALGGTARPWAPELAQKDSRPHGSAKRARGNSQQHRASGTAKRYKGTLWLSCAQLRTGRLRRAHLARRRERRDPGLPGPGPRRTPAPAACRRAGRPVRGEPPAPAPAGPPAGGKGEKSDPGHPVTSGRFVPRPSSRMAKGTLKGTRPPASGLGDCPRQEAPGRPGSSPPPHPCMDTGSLLLRGERLGPGPTLPQLPCSERVPLAAPPCASAATPESCSPEPCAPLAGPPPARGRSPGRGSHHRGRRSLPGATEGAPPSPGGCVGTDYLGHTGPSSLTPAGWQTRAPALPLGAVSARGGWGPLPRLGRGPWSSPAAQAGGPRTAHRRPGSPSQSPQEAESGRDEEAEARGAERLQQ